MSHHRRHRKPCRVTGKVRCRDMEAAVWLGQRVLRARADRRSTARYRLAPALWTYVCPHCGDWHLTSQDQGEDRRVPDPDPGTRGTVDLPSDE